MAYFDELLIKARRQIAEAPLVPLSLANAQYLQISNEIPPAIPSYEFSSYTRYGQAQVILNRQTGVPLVEDALEKRTVRIYPIRLAFQVDQDELDLAAEVGNNVVATKLTTVRDGIDQKLDIVSYIGQPGTTLQGLGTNTNVTIVLFAADGNENGGTNSTSWTKKTPKQILRDLNKFAIQVPTQTANLKSINRVLMPVSWLNFLQTTLYNDAGDTLLSVFLKNQGVIANGIREIVAHPALEQMGAGGTGLMIGYNTNGQNRLHIPKKGDFRDLPGQPLGTTIQVTCQLRTAGVEIQQTLEVIYANLS